MSVLKRASLGALGLLGLSLVFVTDSAPAASQAPNAWQLLAGCAERVQELEAEVEVLRKQLRDQRRELARVSPAAKAAAGQGSAAQESDCAVPFEISPEGIKHFKEQCVHALPTESCDVPYVLDARGLKSFKRACVAE